MFISDLVYHSHQQLVILVQDVHQTTAMVAFCWRGNQAGNQTCNALSVSEMLLRKELRSEVLDCWVNSGVTHGWRVAEGQKLMTHVQSVPSSTDSAPRHRHQRPVISQRFPVFLSFSSNI